MGAENRKDRRRKVSQIAMMVDEGGSVIGPCTMLDVSAGGARLVLATEIDLPSQFTLFLSRYDLAAKRHCTLAWKKGTQVGIRFPEAHIKRPPPKS